MSKLRNLKDSPNPVENSIFRCVVQTLFDEYRFFSKYPEKERNLTAVLLGSLIRENMLDEFALAEAFRLLLDSIQLPKGDVYCHFALKVLRLVAHKLQTWPQIHAQVLQVYS